MEGSIMECPEKMNSNPLKRSFDDMNSQPETGSNFMSMEDELKVYEMAMKKNTIAFLETEVVKSRITVMMIKEIGKTLKNKNGGKKLIVFLAPNVNLVHKHYEEIRSHTELEVEEFYGAKGVDGWDLNTWQKEVDEHDVLVMTPQILINAVRDGFLNFDALCFIILDECHHATGNHPYARIMKEFYHKSRNRAKIFGMTTSPVIKKGVSSIRKQEQILELEELLDSECYMIVNKMELDEFNPMAKQSCRFYDPIEPTILNLKATLESLWSKFDAVLLAAESSKPSHYCNSDDKYSLMRKRLETDSAKILSCLEDLGLLCTYEAVKVCLENAPKVEEECEVYTKSALQHGNFLQEVLSMICESIQPEQDRFLDVRHDVSEAVASGKISPKLHELLKFFESFRTTKEISCVVFVERTFTAVVIEEFLKKIIDMSCITVSYLIGSDSAADMLTNETVKSSLSGMVNLLFATDVAEKGINVSKCCVICFDLPKTVHSYTRSLKLASGSDSQYITMLERGNKKQIDQMSHIIRSEYSVTDKTISKQQDLPPVIACATKETQAYTVEATGASVTTDSSISLLNRYCQKLRVDKNSIIKPNFEYLLEGHSYRCKLALPPGAAFESIIGPESRNTRSSKQLVCLEACKKLHMMGVLSDNLLPFGEKRRRVESSSNHTTCKKVMSTLNDDLSSGEKPHQNDSLSNNNIPTLGAGTTKRKELHGTTSVRQLSGTWGDQSGGFIFSAYKMEFACSIPEQHYCSFVLLVESKLDDDVGNIEVDLYLISKSVKSSVSFCGQIHLDGQQMAKAKCFQELFFNGLFGKLFVKSSGERKFLLQNDESLWDPSNMYLLLPLKSDKHETLEIKWRAIESCVSVVEFLKKNALLNIQQPEANGDIEMNDSIETKFNSNVIHLANKSVSLENLQEMVVVAIHTGRIYSILKAVENTSAQSPFEGDADASYSSYADYYHKKYGIVLRYPEQPLLLLKQSHCSHNLLVDFRNEGISSGKCGGKVFEPKPQQHVHIPPELLVGTDVKTDVLKSFYLFPSLMHRLESLMLASQLREAISPHVGDSNISSLLILEALTSLLCNESFSMERLELLGDSVLKYAVSCYLYHKYPNKHEGALTAIRSKTICNSTLHKLGTDHNLQEYIRDSPFDPRRWTAPGQKSIWPSPCDHGLDTKEVPLDSKFFSEDPKQVVGKTCDRGHRWMGSKTLSDCVEALIGAYYVGGGLITALRFMTWLGIDVEVELSLVNQAIKIASLHSYRPKAHDIQNLEAKIGYEFSVKGLLLEAITHETEQRSGPDCCYERLEFLGDSVLDILITWHLYQNHTDLDPGELTDLRSANVNNGNFAITAVRRNLHVHLIHGSGFIESQISDFLKSLPDLSNTTVLAPDVKAPKVLGDLVESIAGALLIDTNLNLYKVWEVFKPLLSPIVTPEELELPPFRELTELCDSLGYFFEVNAQSKGDTVLAEIKLQLEDVPVPLVKSGSGYNRKSAKGMAALSLLKELEQRGISSSKKRREEIDPVNASSSLPLDGNGCSKKHKSILEGKCHDPVIVEKASRSKKLEVPVLPPISMKKGGPRTSLFDLCKRQLWPMPRFETTEHKSRTPIEIGDKTGFNSFEARITLKVPDFGDIALTGEARLEKKNAYDSAALLMLYELERQGLVILG